MSAHPMPIDVAAIRAQRHARTRALLVRDLAAAEKVLAGAIAEPADPAWIERCRGRVGQRQVALQRHDARGQRSGLLAEGVR